MLYRAPNCVGSPHWLLALCCLSPSIHEKTTNYKIYQGTTLLRRQMSLFLQWSLLGPTQGISSTCPSKLTKGGNYHPAMPKLLPAWSRFHLCPIQQLVPLCTISSVTSSIYHNPPIVLPAQCSAPKACTSNGKSH